MTLDSPTPLEIFYLNDDVMEIVEELLSIVRDRGAVEGWQTQPQRGTEAVCSGLPSSGSVNP